MLCGIYCFRAVLFPKCAFPVNFTNAARPSGGGRAFAGDPYVIYPVLLSGTHHSSLGADAHLILHITLYRPTYTDAGINLATGILIYGSWFVDCSACCHLSKRNEVQSIF